MLPLKRLAEEGLGIWNARVFNLLDAEGDTIGRATIGVAIAGGIGGRGDRRSLFGRY